MKLACRIRARVPGVERQRAPRLIPVVLALTLLSLAASPASAHDGGFGHSRRTLFFTTSKSGLVLEYRVKQGMEEGLVELVAIDTDRNGKISTVEEEAYFKRRGAELLARLGFSTIPAEGEKQGKPLAAKFVDYRLHHSLVQIYRFEIEAGDATLLFEDRNYAHKPGLINVEVGKGLKAELAQPVDLTHAEFVSLKISRGPKE